jgi:hypothetical protein
VRGKASLREPERSAEPSAGSFRRGIPSPAASEQPTHHITFSFVSPGMNWALLGLLAGVALMLMRTAMSASSFQVGR